MDDPYAPPPSQAKPAPNNQGDTAQRLVVGLDLALNAQLYYWAVYYFAFEFDDFRFLLIPVLVSTMAFFAGWYMSSMAAPFSLVPLFRWLIRSRT